MEFDPKTYGDQPLSQRTQHGLAMDRYSNHYFAYLSTALWNAKEATALGNPIPLIDPAMLYRTQRKLSWHTKRRVNAKIADLDNIHKQMIELLKPVLLDVFLGTQPTARDWKRLSGKDEKQTRRTEEMYQHVVRRSDNAHVLLREQDGTITAYPQKFDRGGNSDGRFKEITTEYSSPGAGHENFDLRMFADWAYVRRERRFWRDAVQILSRLLEDSRIRSKKQWLIYHIVNNDIALHVIFDNISVECESRWLTNLGKESQLEICSGMPLPYDFTKDNAKKAVREHERFVADFEKEIPDNLEKYAISPPKMRKRVYDLIIESAMILKPLTGESVYATNIRRHNPETWLHCPADEWEIICAALATSSLSKNGG